jgi:serine/threonine-protein kinase RsbW
MADFAARLDELTAVLAFVERRSEELGTSRDVALRAALIAEELFVNCLRHGLAPERSRVRIELQCVDGELELGFEDEGLAFDPFAQPAADAPHFRPSEERPVGGLGVVLVDSFALRRDYRRLETRNCVRVWLAARAP